MKQSAKKFNNLDELIDESSDSFSIIYIILGWERDHWRLKKGHEHDTALLKKEFKKIIRELIDLGMREIYKGSDDTKCSTGGVIVDITNYEPEPMTLTISADLGGTCVCTEPCCGGYKIEGKR